MGERRANCELRHADDGGVGCHSPDWGWFFGSVYGCALTAAMAKAIAGASCSASTGGSSPWATKVGLNSTDRLSPLPKLKSPFQPSGTTISAALNSNSGAFSRLASSIACLATAAVLLGM